MYYYCLNIIRFYNRNLTAFLTEDLLLTTASLAAKGVPGPKISKIKYQLDAQGFLNLVYLGLLGVRAIRVFICK